jgi:hypothetical protein
VLAHLPLKKYRYIVYVFVVSVYPVAIGIFAPLLEDPSAIYHALCDFSADISRDVFCLRQGFGSSSHISMPEGIVPPFHGGLLGGLPIILFFIFT